MNSSQPRSFRAAQLRILFATMFCYLFYYTGRQSIGFAVPGIQAELGLSKAQIGWISAALLWAYALGQAINGNLADIWGGRRMISGGAVASCGLNWLASFATSLGTLIVPWGLNGYAQSMGWAPGSRILSNWWEPNRRGLVYGAYVFAAGLSSVLTYITSTLILEFHLSWRWIFRLPVLLLAAGGIIYYFVVSNRPEDEGFAPIEDDAPQPAAAPTAPSHQQKSSSWARYQVALRHPRFMIACLAIGFQSIARYGLLIWVPVYFLGDDWEKSSTKWISVALPVGMAFGALINGWASDRLFGRNRSVAIASFMLIAAACAAAMFAIPRHSPAAIPFIFLTGFFAYGPQSAFWALCPDLLGENAGTGTGVMNAFAYAFAGCGEPFIGWVIDATAQTSLIFVIVAVSCLFSGLISIAIRH